MAAPLASTLVVTPLGNGQTPVASYSDAPQLPVQKESRQSQVGSARSATKC